MEQRVSRFYKKVFCVEVKARLSFYQSSESGEGEEGVNWHFEQIFKYFKYLISVTGVRILGQKTAFLAKHSVFLRYAHITHFLTSDGFPVGARSAAQRAVFWPRLPKMALFGPKICLFYATPT